MLIISWILKIKNACALNMFRQFKKIKFIDNLKNIVSLKHSKISENFRIVESARKFK
jgi:hypothetical protein